MADPFGESPKGTEKSSEVDDLYPSYMVNTFFNAFLSYTAIMLNVLTIYVIRKTSSLPNTLKTLLLSLAVADLGVGLLVQPFYIAPLIRRIQDSNRYLSIYTAFVTIVTLLSFASLFGVMALSVDRFLAIRLHLRYQELVTHKRVVAVMISLWVFSAFLSLITLWIPTVVAYLIFSIIDFVCLTTTTLLNYKIYVTVRRLKNQVQVLQVQDVQHTAQNGEMTNVASLRKSALGTFYIYLVFLVCYLPQICSYAVIMFSESRTVRQVLFLCTLTMVFLNSSLNPVIYCLKMRHFRRAVTDLLRKLLTFH